jgi:hypothetical protein
MSLLINEAFQQKQAEAEGNGHVWAVSQAITMSYFADIPKFMILEKCLKRKGAAFNLKKFSWKILELR